MASLKQSSLIFFIFTVLFVFNVANIYAIEARSLIGYYDRKPDGPNLGEGEDPERPHSYSPSSVHGNGGDPPKRSLLFYDFKPNDPNIDNGDGPQIPH